MGRMFRIKSRLRRFARRHPRIHFALRAFILFSAAFGGAYGFIAGSRSADSGYDPHTFAIGVSFLFALACAGLALTSMRLRWMRRKLRAVTLRNEALVDRNWELKEAEERARILFESQGDLVVLRRMDGTIASSTTPIARWHSNRAKRARHHIHASGAGTGRSSPIPPAPAFTNRRSRTATARDGSLARRHRAAGRRTAAELQCVGRDVTDRAETERA